MDDFMKRHNSRMQELHETIERLNNSSSQIKKSYDEISDGISKNQDDINDLLKSLIDG